MRSGESAADYLPILPMSQAVSMPRSSACRRPSTASIGSVAVAFSGDPSTDEVAEMTLDVLQSERVTSNRVEDGDVEALAADMLLLTGSGRAFPKFADLIRGYSGRRPRVVLWHLQPLPPPVLTRRATDLGERLLAARWESLLGRWAEPLNQLLPVRGRTRQVLQRLLALSLRREFERTGGIEYGNVGAEDLCMVFQEAAWLEESLARADRWIDVVACNTPTRVAFLRQCGIAAQFVPLGFHPAWGDLQSEDRDIDVLFVGSLHAASRRALVPQVLRQLSGWGYRTCEVDLIPAGKERTQLLQRSRVMLNILRFPWEFPGPRLFASAACGALCVSDEAVQNEPFQPGLHFVRAPRARMAESIGWYLNNESERRRRAALALQSFASDFPLKRSVAQLLDLAAGDTRQARFHAA